jgi:hypothetical protein
MSAARWAIGGVVGLLVGLLVSAVTDIPLAPEVGLALGLLIAWMAPR